MVSNIGFADLLTISDFKLSPNPTNDFVTVQLSNLTDASIEIMDAQGKIVLNRIAFNNGELLDFRNFERGVYFVRVYSSTGNAVQRIVKN